jgi:PEP-CTERM motif
MKTPRRTRLLLIAIVALAAQAFGTAVFTLGNHPQPNEQNILFQTDQTGMTIDAFTNISHTMVQFSSTTDTLVGTGGQSDLDAVDGLINDVTFTVPGHTFLDFIFNPFKPGANGDLVVTVVTNTGPFTFTYGDKHGNNFLTVTTTGGEVIDSVTIDSASGFQGLKQPRVSGISGVVVTPEPSSLFLVGSGVLGLAQVLRRRRTR